MSVDVLAPIVSSAFAVKFFYRLRSFEEEIRVYGDILEAISALVSDIDSTLFKPSTVITPEAREKMVRETLRAKSALENARRAVGWRGGSRGQEGVMLRRIKWAFKYTDTAKVHKEFLFLCHKTLLSIGRQLAAAQTNIRQQRPSETYFQETGARALARQIGRHAAMYSGVGVEAPRPRLFGPEL